MRRQVIRRHPVVICLTVFVAWTTSASAQEASQPTQKPDTTLRELHVIITDNKGNSLDDLTQGDIQLIEDGVPQTIESFSLQALPVVYGLVIDTSRSLESQFATLVETARNIVGSNKLNDQAFIVRFVHSSRIDVVQETTSDKSQLSNALGKLRVEPGQTALIDAVYVSAEKLLKAESVARDVKHRKALVLITDGEDRVSFYKEDDLFKMLQKVNLKIFVIGLVQELDPEGGFIRKAPRERAIKLIERLAKETGGRAFFPQKVKDFPRVATEVVHDLQLQYVVRYRSLSAKTKAYHQLEIKVSNASDNKKRRAILKSKYTAAEIEQIKTN